MATPQELAAQIQAAQGATQTAPQTAQVSTVDPVQTPTTAPVAPVNTATPEAPKTGATDNYLNLGKGKVVKKDSAQYKALIASGMNDEQIISKYNEKTAKVNAPVQPVTDQKQDNIQPAPANTPTQQNTTAAMPVLPDFKDDSQARQSEIIANLNKYKTENPGMMTDRNLFNQSFSYDQRSPLQKGILDNWYTNNIQKASETASLSRMASSDIALGYSNGTISDSDLSNLQQTDTAKYADIQESIKQQQSMQKYSNLLYGDEQKTQQPSIIDQMMKTMQGMMSTTASTDLYDEYEKALNSPEVTSLMNDVTDKENAVNQTDEQMNATKSELEAQFKGSGISQGRIDAIMQDQLQLLQNKKNGQILEYNAAAKKYSNKMSVIKDTMDIKEKKFQMQMQQEQSQVQKMGFMYGIYSDQQKRTDAMKASDLQFKRDVTLMNEKYEKDFNQAIKLDKLQNGDINSADPYIVDKAIGKNVDDMMKQYDGLITSSRDQLVTRIKEGIKAGKPYGAVLGEITKDIQSKPEYGMRRNAKLGIDTKPTSLGGGLISIPDGKGGYTIMTEDQFKAKSNIPNEQISAITKSIQAERATSGQSQYDNYDVAQACLAEVGTVGGQCGAFVNNIFQSNGGERLFTNTIDAKIAATKSPSNYSPVPVVGGAVVIDNGASYTDANGKQINAGHVAIVTGVNADGSIDYVDSNGRAGKEKVGMNKGIPVSSKMYFTKAPGKESPTSGAISGALNSAVKTILGSGKFTKDQSAAIVNSIQSGDDPLAVIKNQAKNIMGQTQSNDLAGYEVAKGQMESISALMKKYYDAGGKTDIFKGKYEKAINKLGKVDNPELVNLTTQIAVALQAYRKAVTGTAFSVQEGAEMAAIFPGIDNTKGLNDAIIGARLKSFDDLIDTTYRNTLGSSYDQLKPKQAETNASTTILGKTAPISYGWQYGGGNTSYAGYASTLYNK